MRTTVLVLFRRSVLVVTAGRRLGVEFRAASGRAVRRYLLPPSASVAEELRPRHARGREFTPRELVLASAVVLLVLFSATGQRVTQPDEAPEAATSASATVSLEPPLPNQPASAESEARVLPPELNAPTSAPKAAASAEPSAPASPEAAAPGPRERWLPSGTGMWLHEWDRSEGGSAADVVARALDTGMTHLFVQTGSSGKGWIGDEVLSELMPATKDTGLAVIAWDFPKLVDPVGDARRLAAAVTWSQGDSPRVAAVAPDIETPAEGTRLTSHAVLEYYRELRRQLPDDVPILATVPWPSEKRTSSYPYAESAAHADAFIPMAYWYNRDPFVVTQTSMEWLAQYGKPVMPVGQGYDGRLDAPYLPADPDPATSVWRFMDAAKAGGARSVSLWSWQTTGERQWSVLKSAAEAYWGERKPS